jgi:hypothetical protein
VYLSTDTALGQEGNFLIEDRELAHGTWRRTSKGATMPTKRKKREVTAESAQNNDASTFASTASRQKLAQNVDAITRTRSASTGQPRQFLNGGSIGSQGLAPRVPLGNHCPPRAWTDVSTTMASQPIYICVSLNDSDPLGINIEGVASSSSSNSNESSSSAGENIDINSNREKVLRIQEVVARSQGDVAGLKVGDVVVSAMVGGSAIKWSEFMSFGAFVSVVKSAQRPILLQVRRDPISIPSSQLIRNELEETLASTVAASATSESAGAGAETSQPQTAVLLSVSATSTENQLPARIGKRGRPKKVLSREERAERDSVTRQRLKDQQLKEHVEKLAITRQSRQDIIRAFELRVAADEIEHKNFGGTTINNATNTGCANSDISNNSQGLGNVAQHTIRNTIRSMREEANEVWDHPLHGDWESDFKTLLLFRQHHGHCVVTEQNSERYSHLWKFVKSARVRHRHYPPRKRSIQDFRDIEADMLKRIG